MKYKYYEKLDIVRLIAVVAVLLFHLNILKGGFLAVCVFFVLSGYLSAISSFKKKDFSFKDYYINKFKRLYVPLLIVVFLTIGIVSLIPSINWINLKPETISVLGGYNNFWQLKANLDYFTRSADSPFIHFWFIAILLEFDLLYPFLYLLLKKITDKVNRIIPLIILSGLCIISSIYFYICYKNKDLMFVYYSNSTRIFSLLYGLWLGYIKVFFGHLVPKFKYKITNCIIYYLYVLVLIVSFFLIGYDSKYLGVMLIIVSLLSVRIIDYGTLEEKKENKILKYLTSFSYEIYLVQYPVIYLFTFLNMNSTLKIIVIIISVVLISYLLKFVQSKNKNIVLNYGLKIIVLICCFFGVYKFFMMKDYSKEMKELEEQLKQNELLVLKKQEEYSRRIEKELANKDSIIKKYENSEKNLDEKVANLDIVGIGDSVMLGAVGDLYKKFPNGYFDAQISRTGWVADGILSNLKKKNMLGDVVIISLGTNGDCPTSIKESIMETIGNRLVLWINVTNDKDVKVNDNLKKFASKYSNLYIIDWYSLSKGHSDYFIADGIHLTAKGRNAYTQAIFDGIYNIYLEQLQNDKKQVLGNMENAQRENYSFYGNDLLINALEYLEKEFEGAKYVASKDYSIQDAILDIKKDIENNSLNNNIVLLFIDDNIGVEEYEKVINLCKTKNVYIVTLGNNLKTLKDKATIINIKDYNKYLMVDKIHLTNEGNKILVKEIIKAIKNE